MKAFNKKLAVLAFAALPLAGCNTSAISTHGNFSDTDRTVTNSIDQDRGSTFKARPASDHISLRGDQSKRLLADGQMHFSGRNYGLAVENFRKAVEVRADNAAAWLGLAASYDQLGRFDFADRAYEQVAGLKGDNARLHNNRGYSYLLRGNYSKASYHLNKAQTLDSSIEEIQGNLHLLAKVSG